MDTLHELAAWAWARHHNILSWYIRPLFLIPYCWFAWRRSVRGMVSTVIALVTSMAWFPAPDVVDPQVERFLAAEREYLLGTWTVAKVAMTLLVPAMFALLAAAFWRGSVRFGVAVIVAAAMGKIVWSLRFGSGAGGAVVAPAVLGLILTVATVWWWTRRPTGGRFRSR